MKREKIEFENADGKMLSARIELPVDRHPHNFVIFAHCFTCGKNLTAIRNISRSLTAEGFAVMNFDFTGLGESSGDFSETNFSSNVSDLLAAARYLDEHYKSPTVLVGHSLGGAAVIYAAARIKAIKAVATIGAPADPDHVKKLFSDDMGTIQKSGQATVDIGGRKFTVKKQFFEDLRQHQLTDVINELDQAILIMHSPQDKIVDISNAALLYEAARHSKSFVSLDGADHLLSEKNDAQYAGFIIAAWAKRYLKFPVEEDMESPLETVAWLGDDDKFTTQIKAGDHHLVADEPEDAGGFNYGPSPYQLLTSALGACTAMTVRMYANKKKWDLQDIKVHLEHKRVHAEDCINCEGEESKIDHIQTVVEIEGDLDNTQRKRLLEIAKKCPVHRTLHSEVQIETSLKSE